MTIITPPIFLTLIFFILSLPQPLTGVGSGGTLAVSDSTATVCGIVSGEPIRRIECVNDRRKISVLPNVSFDSISGGRSYFCGLRSGGHVMLCWNTTTFSPKRVYFNNTAPLREISIGDDQVCGIVNSTNLVKCWRSSNHNPTRVYRFRAISSGFGFSCGISMINSRVRCWGSNLALADQIQSEFENISMDSIVAGGKHVCGFNSIGFLVCKGSNSYGQLDFPFSVYESSGFFKLALGLDYSCAIRQSNGSIVCWGSGYSSNMIQGVEFETLVGGLNFTCGLLTRNFSIFCWGRGWLSHGSLGIVDLPKILPGPCVQSKCGICGIYPDSQSLCFGYGNICNACSISSINPPFSPPSITPPPSKGLRKGMLAFAIIGSIGGFTGICTIIYYLYTGICCGRKKIHNSVQPTITRGGSNIARTSTNSPPPRSFSLRRHGSRVMKRQRSGTSSFKHPERAEEFSFQELALATGNFSLDNKIGSGSFGVVYKGKLSDGREVAIKRSETCPRTKKFQEKESAFESELAFLSRLHHKHLVGLVGYCEERDERLLVYEHMKNGALHDHLHDKNNVEKSNSVINSWKLRIKIALDASRGIEYLHNYAVPPIIHRDIKSSNILIDANWTARVSDFGLSLMDPESDQDLRPLKAVGTVGYMDPEYYGLNVLTSKSDVYGFGIVLLELLTGKRAIFKDEKDGGTPMSVVDFAIPSIMAGELVKILDSRVGFPESNESEAVEIVAYTALHCVNMESKVRPTMTDIVANLERALNLCDDSHGSISSSGLSNGRD